VRLRGHFPRVSAKGDHNSRVPASSPKKYSNKRLIRYVSTYRLKQVFKSLVFKFQREIVADDIKMRLVEAAGKAFADKGFDAVGIREICQEAEANVAAVNYYFGDKKGLYCACLRHAQSCYVEELAAPQWPADLPPTEKLRAFIYGALKAKLDPSRPQWHQDLMLRELTRPSEACREIVEDYIRPMAQTLGGILQELMPGAKWDRQMWLIGFSIVGQMLFHQAHQPVARILMGDEAYQSLTLEDLADHIARFCLAAIGQGLPVDVTGPSEFGPTLTSEP
jgi:AcrR family transcriptional regulator